jgi:hypothetical protein
MEDLLVEDLAAVVVAEDLEAVEEVQVAAEQVDSRNKIICH